MRSTNYLETLPNSPKGWQQLGRKRYIARLIGLLIVVYGRGPRKRVYQYRALNQNNWESHHPWGEHARRHYRPKLADCTHFDCYLYRRVNKRLIPVDWAAMNKDIS